MHLSIVLISSALVFAGMSTALPVERVSMLVSRSVDSGSFSGIEARAEDGYYHDSLMKRKTQRRARSFQDIINRSNTRNGRPPILIHHRSPSSSTNTLSGPLGERSTSPVVVSDNSSRGSSSPTHSNSLSQSSPSSRRSTSMTSLGDSSRGSLSGNSLSPSSWGSTSIPSSSDSSRGSSSPTHGSPLSQNYLHAEGKSSGQVSSGRKSLPRVILGDSSTSIPSSPSSWSSTSIPDSGDSLSHSSLRAKSSGQDPYLTQSNPSSRESSPSSGSHGGNPSPSEGNLSHSPLSPNGSERPPKRVRTS